MATNPTYSVKYSVPGLSRVFKFDKTGKMSMGTQTTLFSARAAIYLGLIYL
jgi:hypothetical protein